MLTISKGRVEKQAPRKLYRGVSGCVHAPRLDQYRLICGFQRHRFPRRGCLLWYLFHTYFYSGVPTVQGHSLGTRTVEHGPLRSSDQHHRPAVDRHHLDLFILPNRNPGHKRDHELEFGLVGLHHGVWDPVVFCVPEAQVHRTRRHFRAIRHGLSQRLCE